VAHLFLSDGSALFDHLGPEFTLLSVGVASTGDFAGKAKALGVPLKILSLNDDVALRILGTCIMLIRPDHHIAWLSDGAPADCEIVLRRVTGNS
jgi:hypothetical protein